MHGKGLLNLDVMIDNTVCIEVLKRVFRQLLRTLNKKVFDGIGYGFVKRSPEPLLALIYPFPSIPLFFENFGLDHKDH